MAKTHAQRQQEYRERKKADNECKWLEAERKRTNKYYTGTDELSPSDVNKRRERVRKQVKKHRLRIKMNNKKQASQNEDVSCSEISSTSDIPQPSTSATVHGPPLPSQRLVIKLPASTRTRVNRRVARQKRKIRSLETVNMFFKRKTETLRKQLSRLKKNTTKSSQSPRAKADKTMRSSGISPRKHQQVRRQLILKNCLTEEIKESVKENPGKTHLIKTVVAGKIIRKYGMSKSLSAATKMRLRAASNIKKRIEMNNRKKVKRGYQKLREDVRVFMEREDNSRQLPGKADSVKGEDKQRRQKFVLNDYLHNLHLKFMAENPGRKICRSTFSRLRPKHISPVNFASRVTCLCIRHQNFALKLQSLKKMGVNGETSPDKFIENTDDDGMNEMLTNIDQEEIEFKQWKRVTGADGKQRTKLVNCENDKKEFTENVKREYKEFGEHAERVKIQYEAFREMKTKLKLESHKNHVCVQMDFAENYGIKEMQEIQSAYWNPEMVTLHPVVVYYNDESENVAHKSFVAVSEVLQHNASMVRAIIDKVVVEVKTICPDVQYIHYFTDSPTSQYRNKTNFDLVARHPELYTVNASWQFFEAGHGKGACDGIGGVAKRMADNAVKSGKAAIQSGRDFYKWGNEMDSQVKYIFVEREEYEAASEAVESRQKDLIVVKGTMKIHSVFALTQQKIISRETTCCCEHCFTDSGFKYSNDNRCKWRVHLISHPKDATDAGVNVVSTESVEMNENIEQEDTVVHSDITEGSFIAALYDDRPYVGKVIGVDGSEYDITFMESGSKIKNCLKWPKNEDEVWIPKADIICTVSEPMPTGRGKRTFKLTDEENQHIEECMRKKMRV